MTGERAKPFPHYTTTHHLRNQVRAMKPNKELRPQHINDPVDQTEWMLDQSAYTTVDDLYQSDPNLFDSLATDWRSNNPWDGLGD